MVVARKGSWHIPLHKTLLSAPFPPPVNPRVQPGLARLDKVNFTHGPYATLAGQIAASIAIAQGGI